MTRHYTLDDLKAAFESAYGSGYALGRPGEWFKLAAMERAWADYAATLQVEEEYSHQKCPCGCGAYEDENPHAPRPGTDREPAGKPVGSLPDDGWIPYEHGEYRIDGKMVTFRNKAKGSTPLPDALDRCIDDHQACNSIPLERDWQREHDKLMLQEVDRRIQLRTLQIYKMIENSEKELELHILSQVQTMLDDCQQNWKAATEATVESMRQQIKREIAEAAREATQYEERELRWGYEKVGVGFDGIKFSKELEAKE